MHYLSAGVHAVPRACESEILWCFRRWLEGLSEMFRRRKTKENTGKDGRLDVISK